MAEIECPRCRPGVTTLTSVVTCMGQGGQTAMVKGKAFVVPRVDVDKMREPYFGKGRSKNMYGAGFVVGFKTAGAPGKASNGTGDRWRLDYDPDKGLHVNFESDRGDLKVCHRFGRIDAQPFVAKVVPMPPGLAKLVPEEQIRRMWFAWSQHYIAKARGREDVLVEMGSAYQDLRIRDSEQFIQMVAGADSYASIAHLLKSIG